MKNIKLSPVSAFLHSYSQVVLLQNTISGFLIGLAIFMYDIQLGALSVLATIIGNVTALLITKDGEGVNKGLYGFNPLLVGIASGVFFERIDVYIAAVVGSILCTPITIILNGLFNRLKVPGLTLPFIVTTWLLILLSFSGNLLNNFNESLLIMSSVQNTSFAQINLLDIVFKGIGEIFLLDSVISSILILIAFAISDFKNIFRVGLAIVASIILGFIFGVDYATLNLGLYTYNSILLVMGVETFSSINVKDRYINILLGLVLTFLADMALAPTLSLFALPVLTFSFVIITWGMLILEQELTLKKKQLL